MKPAEPFSILYGKHEIQKPSAGSWSRLANFSICRAEQVIADRLTRIVSGRLPWPWIDEEKAVPWIEKRSGLQLADSQRAAIRLALMAKALVITGGPGVGKTTIVNAILKIVSAKGVRLLLCAPTGRAAKRLRSDRRRGEDDPPALEVDPKGGGFKRNARPSARLRPARGRRGLDGRRHADAQARPGGPGRGGLLLVGDVDQLPSVGPGQVLADIIGSGVVPVVRLTEVFRQAAASRIVVNAHRINPGEMPDLSASADGGDFYFVDADDPETAVQRILAIGASASRSASAWTRSATSRCSAR